MGKLRYYLYKAFPKVFSLEEVTSEQSFSLENKKTRKGVQGANYILWDIYADTADIVLEVKHTYKKGDKVVYERMETLTFPYRFTHAEPSLIRPNGANGVEIDVKKLKGFPVVKFSNMMLDVSKVAYPDFQSQPLRKGRILMDAKTQIEVDEGYLAWLEALRRDSVDILSRAMN